MVPKRMTIRIDTRQRISVPPNGEWWLCLRDGKYLNKNCKVNETDRYLDFISD